MKPRKNIFEFLMEAFGWLQIMTAPLLTGVFTGLIIYLSRPDNVTLVIAIIFCVAGLLTGAIFATRVWKKKGTQHFLSRTSATPEPDKES